MTTVEVRENKAEKASEACSAGAEFFRGLMCMLSAKIPVKIVFVGSLAGDIVFTCTLSDLGIVPQDLSHPICYSNIFADMLGELLVRSNLELFSARVMDQFYNTTVKAYCHKHFGLKTTGDGVLRFQCHSSLIHKLYNIWLDQELAEESAKIPPAIVRSKKVTRCDEHERITTFEDSPGKLRLIVPKTSELRVCLENAMETVLDHYEVKNKDILITDNMFSFQIEITDKVKDK